MSEIPALREALRATARRKVRQRRRRLTLAVAVPIAVACVAVALASVEPAPDEVSTPATTPTPVPAKITLDDAERELAKVYGVFRRPARASDRPPKGMSGPKVPPVAIEWERARRVATLGDRAAYLVPAVYNGKVGFCLYTRTAPGKPGGGGCGEFDPAGSRPIWNKTFERPGTVYALLLPDGVGRVTVHFKGRTETRPAGENGFIFQGRQVRRFTWRDAEGNEHSARASI